MSTADITNLFNLISWREPLWLFLVLVPLLVWWFRLILQPRQASFADTHLMPWIATQQFTGIWQWCFSKNSAFLIAWLLFGIAASGPRLPIELVSQEQTTDIDIMLVVDVSRSMHVTDMSPSRIRRAQIEIEELLERISIKRMGIRAGVIVFAARPHLLSPLTSDHEALRFYLQSLDTLVLPTHGSEPTTALTLAHKELMSSKNPSAIIMMTDGDFSTFPDNAISVLNQAKIPLYILGIGSAEGGAVPLKNGEWLHYEGRPVISRLNDKRLRELADQAIGNRGSIGNNYSPALDDASDWQQLFDTGIASLVESTENQNTDQNYIWQELFHWPLFSALVMLLLSLSPYGYRLHPRFTINTYISSPYSKATTSATIKTISLVATIILLGIYPPQKTYAANLRSLKNDGLANEYQAFKNYANGNFPAALSLYKQLPGYAARLGEGSSYYKMSDFRSALNQYSRAVLAANNDQERAHALFNLGNSYFQTGNYAAAITIYRDAIQYQPDHKNVLHNLKFTTALKKTVDRRLQQIRQAARAGSGPQRELANNLLDNNLRSSLVIDEGGNIESEVLPLPELANISNASLENLINKGLNQIMLAAEDTASIKHTGYKRNKLDFINAHLRMAELEDQQTLLWKQLFEIEEGFPAPLTEPRQMPGIAPW